MIGLWPFFAIILHVSHKEGNKLTLEEALGIAESNAFSIRAADSKVRRADQTANLAASALGPNLGVNAGYSKIHAEYSPSNFQIAPSDYDSKSIGVTISQVIDIAGTTHKSIAAARDLAKAQRESRKAELQNLRNLIRSKFYGVLQSQENVRIQQDALRTNKDRLDKANLKYKAGAIPKFDVLRFETQEKQSEQDLIDAQSVLEVSKQDFNNALARPIETEFEPVPVEGFSDIAQPAAGYVEVALASRPEVKQQEFNVSAFGKQVDAASSGTKPSLVLSATHTEFPSPFSGGTKNQTVGSATLSWPLFDGGATQAKVKAAKEDEEQGKIALEQIRLTVALEVRTAFTQALAQRNALTVAQKNAELAKEALRLAQLRLDEGAGTTLDVISAQSDFTRAQSGQAVAAYKYRIAVANLQKAVGSDDLAKAPQELTK